MGLLGLGDAAGHFLVEGEVPGLEFLVAGDVCGGPLLEGEVPGLEVLVPGVEALCLASEVLGQGSGAGGQGLVGKL